jgi:hypothetical protein
MESTQSLPIHEDVIGGRGGGNKMDGDHSPHVQKILGGGDRMDKKRYPSL